MFTLPIHYQLLNAFFPLTVMISDSVCMHIRYYAGGFCQRLAWLNQKMKSKHATYANEM